MAMRERPLLWDSQPQEAVRINAGHWLAGSVLFASDGHSGYVWHEPTAPVVSGLASVPMSAAGPLGAIRAWAPDGSGYVRWAIPPRAGNGITLGVWVQGVASTTNDQVFSVSHATASNGGRSIRRLTSELYVANRINSGLSNTGDASTNAATASAWQFIVGTFTSDIASDVWLDGVKGPEGSGNSRVVSTVDSVLVGTVIPAGSAFETATTAIRGIGPAYVLDRVLSADEVVLWSAEAQADPWALFEPQRIWVPVSAGAGGDASVTLQGAASTAAVGTLSASGGASASLSGAQAAAQAGALSASGGAVVALDGVQASAQVGAVAASGGAVVALESAAATAAVGSVTASGGGSASVTLTGAQAASAAGAISATGGAGVALLGVQAVGQVGAIDVLAGGAVAVTLPGTAASAAAGSITATGGAQILLSGAQAVATAGAVWATGGATGAISAPPAGRRLQDDERQERISTGARQARHSAGARAGRLNSRTRT